MDNELELVCGKGLAQVSPGVAKVFVKLKDGFALFCANDENVVVWLEDELELLSPGVEKVFVQLKDGFTLFCATDENGDVWLEDEFELVSRKGLAFSDQGKLTAAPDCPA